VMGPDDGSWVAIEQHPQLEEVAAELEPPPRREIDEARLDFNPLIDVALVLLIFFIITASYAALQQVLDMPGATASAATGVLKVSKEKVDQTTIKVEVRMRDGKPVYRVEDQEVDADALMETLQAFADRSNKTEVLLDARGVDWGSVVAVQDAAAGTGRLGKRISKVHYLVPPSTKK
jgi:biopolymer transport protein ExbD